MKRTGTMFLLAALAAPLWAQQFKFNFDAISDKATNTLDISLNGSILQLAAKFFDSDDPDEAKVKKLISSLDGIYVKTFEFKNGKAWADSDFEDLRKQLREPEWSRIVGMKSTEDGETAEIYVRVQNKKVMGVAILAAGSKDLTVVNIVGPVDLDSLAELGGHFGVPKVGTSHAH